MNIMDDCDKRFLMMEIKQNFATLIIMTFFIGVYTCASTTLVSIFDFIGVFIFISAFIFLTAVLVKRMIKQIKDILYGE